MTNRTSPGKPADRRTPPALTVWIYDSALGAAAAEVRLKNLRDRNALEVLDAITVSWMPGSHRPRIGHLRHATRGSVLGELIGLLFLSPATGVGLPAMARRLRGTGIDQTFLEEVKAQLHPESSALLVLSGDVDLRVVRPAIERGLAHGDVVLIHAQMPPGAPELLRDAVRDLQGHAR